jgi:protoporphyrinogen oxidase
MKDEVYGVGLTRLLQLLGSLVWGRCRWRKFESADDYARFWIGSKLFDSSGLAQYIERFYGAPATAIDSVFAEKRMGWLAESASLYNRLKNILAPKCGAKPNQSFVRPRAGFGELYKVARETLEREGTNFALGETIRSIIRHEDLFQVDTDRSVITCDRIISTIPVSRAYRLCGFDGVAPLPASRLISLFFTFAGYRGFLSNVLYNFADRGSWKRLTMFSDFFGKVEGREYFGAEVICNEQVMEAADGARASFLTDIEEKGLFKGTLDFVGFHELDNAYPIYLHGAIDNADRMIASLQAFGVESLGRQGAFDYLPTARQVTLAVEKSMSERVRPGSHLTGASNLDEAGLASGHAIKPDDDRAPSTCCR